MALKYASRSHVWTYSSYLSQGAGAARGVLDAVLGRSHVTQYILGPFLGHD